MTKEESNYNRFHVIAILLIVLLFLIKLSSSSASNNNNNNNKYETPLSEINSKAIHSLIIE